EARCLTSTILMASQKPHRSAKSRAFGLSRLSPFNLRAGVNEYTAEDKYQVWIPGPIEGRQSDSDHPPPLCGRGVGALSDPVHSKQKRKSKKACEIFFLFSFSITATQCNMLTESTAISIDCKGASDYPSAGQPQNHTASDSSKTPRSKATTAKITT